MQREIKFRGQRIDNKEWVYGLLLTNHLGYYIITEENAHECRLYRYIEINEYYRVVRETIGQYTGLKDKNGKEIYEGDILRDGRKREFVVTWNNGIGSWVNRPLDNSNSYPCFNVGTVKHLEKIGNIYENQKLLE
ncbi:MAG TPA: YopX family protein [Thermoclostridium sp.]|nr:YopX family protein [Thermoclostridium sp.]